MSYNKKISSRIHFTMFIDFVQFNLFELVFNYVSLWCRYRKLSCDIITSDRHYHPNRFSTFFQKDKYRL